MDLMDHSGTEAINQSKLHQYLESLTAISPLKSELLCCVTAPSLPPESKLSLLRLKDIVIAIYLSYRA